MKNKNLQPLIEASRTYNRLKGVRDTERQLRYFETRMTKEIGEIFLEQGDILLDKLEEFRHYFQEDIGRDIDYPLNNVFYLTFNRFKDAITRYRLYGAKIAEESVRSSIGMEFSFDKYDIGAYTELEKVAAQRVSGINEVTRERIKQIIMDGYEKQKTYSQIATDIKNEFHDFAAPAPQKHIRNRAELVAVTELRDAHESSQRTQMQSFIDRGYEIEKSWLTTNDERLCDQCRANAEAGWIGYNDLFPDGKIHAPSHPACRCRTIYRIKPGTMGIETAKAGGIEQWNQYI